MLKSCTVCGLISREARCPLHRRDKNAHWSTDRDRGAQGRFRKALVKLYGLQCAAVESGIRCSETTNLQAHHLEPGNDDPKLGRLLCQRHHRMVDRHAR